MMTSATEILRRLLDARGVEYFKHEDGEPLRKLEKADEPATSWHMGGASVCAVPIKGSDLFDLWIDDCTPEQAVATLGSGTCRVESSVAIEFGTHISPDYFEFEMSCGSRFRWSDSEPPDYCPGCGRKVVDA